MLESDDSVTGPINLGNPTQNSMHELADAIIKFTNSNSKITYKELPQDDPKMRQPDISKAIQILDWKPKVDLEEGLTMTIASFKSRM